MVNYLKKVGIYTTVLICFLLVLVTPISANVKNVSDIKKNAIKSITTNVDLQEDGSAYIEQIWDTEIKEGTELYFVLDEDEKTKYSEFSVVNQNMTTFEYEKNWITQPKRTREEKKERYSLVEIDEKNGNKSYEFVFGIGEYGYNTYTIRYKIDSIVHSYDDYDAFNYRFINKEVSPIPEKIITAISSKKTFTQDNTKVWAFGYQGYVHIINGKIIAESVQGSDGKIQNNHQTILARFDKNLFSPSKSIDEKFFVLRDRAFKDSDYPTSGLKNQLIDIKIESEGDTNYFYKEEKLLYYFTESDLNSSPIDLQTMYEVNSYYDDYLLFDDTRGVELKYIPYDQWNQLEKSETADTFTVIERKDDDGNVINAAIRWYPMNEGENEYSFKICFVDMVFRLMSPEKEESSENNTGNTKIEEVKYNNVNLLNFNLNVKEPKKKFNQADYTRVIIHGENLNLDSDAFEFQTFGYPHTAEFKDNSYIVSYLNTPTNTKGYLTILMVDMLKQVKTNKEYTYSLVDEIELIKNYEKNYLKTLNPSLPVSNTYDYSNSNHYSRPRNNSGGGGGGIFALLFIGISIISFFVKVSESNNIDIENKKLKRDRPKKREKKIYTAFNKKEFTYYTDIPLEGNIAMIFRIYDETQPTARYKRIIEAYLLKWLLDDNIRTIDVDMKFDENASSPGSVNNLGDVLEIQFISTPQTEDVNELLLYSILKEMSDADNILKKSAFKLDRLSNTSAINEWYQRMLVSSQKECIELSYATRVRADEFTLTETGIEKGLELFGSKQYLEDYSLIHERYPIEVKLWKEYLILASIYGISDKVYSCFADLYPNIIEKNYDIIIRNSAFAMFANYFAEIFITELAQQLLIRQRVVDKKIEENNQRKSLSRHWSWDSPGSYDSSGSSGSSGSSRYSGGGGSSSIGGGGGSSGGGRGGGIR